VMQCTLYLASLIADYVICITNSNDILALR